MAAAHGRPVMAPWCHYVGPVWKVSHVPAMQAVTIHHTVRIVNLVTTSITVAEAVVGIKSQRSLALPVMRRYLSLKPVLGGNRRNFLPSQHLHMGQLPSRCPCRDKHL